jgi:hypothetical protein
MEVAPDFVNSPNTSFAGSARNYKGDLPENAVNEQELARISSRRFSAR